MNRPVFIPDDAAGIIVLWIEDGQVMARYHDVIGGEGLPIPLASTAATLRLMADHLDGLAANQIDA